jgi:hypothetical protein
MFGLKDGEQNEIGGFQLKKPKREKEVEGGLGMICFHLSLNSAVRGGGSVPNGSSGRLLCSCPPEACILDSLQETYITIK